MAPPSRATSASHSAAIPAPPGRERSGLGIGDGRGRPCLKCIPPGSPRIARRAIPLPATPAHRPDIDAMPSTAARLPARHSSQASAQPAPMYANRPRPGNWMSDVQDPSLNDKCRLAGGFSKSWGFGSVSAGPGLRVNRAGVRKWVVAVGRMARSRESESGSADLLRAG